MSVFLTVWDLARQNRQSNRRNHLGIPTLVTKIQHHIEKINDDWPDVPLHFDKVSQGSEKPMGSGFS